MWILEVRSIVKFSYFMQFCHLVIYYNILFYILLTLADGPMWLLKRRHEITEEDFSSRHTDNSDEDKFLANFNALVQQRMQKSSIFTMKAT
jgi:hypothetical protein